MKCPWTSWDRSRRLSWCGWLAEPAACCSKSSKSTLKREYVPVINARRSLRLPLIGSHQKARPTVPQALIASTQGRVLKPAAAHLSLRAAARHLRTCRSQTAMSASPPKAEIRRRRWDVRSVPEQTHASQQIASLFNHLVGACEQRRRKSRRSDGGFCGLCSIPASNSLVCFFFGSFFCYLVL